VVGLVPDASRALFERTAGVRPRARAALEHADLLVAEARERRRGERGGDAVLAREDDRPRAVRPHARDLRLEPAAADPAGAGHMTERTKPSQMNTYDAPRTAK